MLIAKTLVSRSGTMRSVSRDSADGGWHLVSEA
jgi:hypothetical protein